jgi:hypothetical protein
MARLRDKYSILESMVLHPFTANMGAIVDHNHHEVCLYEKMFKAGFWLPFSMVVRELIFTFHWLQSS